MSQSVIQNPDVRWLGGETGAQREPSENFSEGSRWAPNAQPEPHFRREDGVGVKTGVKMGVKKLFNNPVTMIVSTPPNCPISSPNQPHQQQIVTFSLICFTR